MSNYIHTCIQYITKKTSCTNCNTVVCYFPSVVICISHCLVYVPAKIQRGWSQYPAAIVASVAFGRIEEFRPEADNITSYLERIELFFTANEVADVKQAAVLLSCIGKQGIWYSVSS